MNLTIEIENKEDFPFIKKLMENLKGVKILEKNNDEEIDNFLPLNVQEALDNYADVQKEEDYISKNEFFKFVDSEICRLNSRK